MGLIDGSSRRKGRQTTMPSPLKQIRYSIEAAVVRGVAWAIPKLPRRAVLMLADALGSAAYLFDERGRSTGLANIQAAIAHGRLDAADPEALLKRSYQLFARSMCDLFWASRLTADNHSQFIQVEFEDRPAFERAAKKGAVWVTPHYGNFEWISLMMGYRDHPFTLVAQDFKNPALTEIFTRAREISGHKVIPSQRAMVRLLKALKSGEHAAFLTDLTVAPDSAAVPIRCFDMLTCVTGLHAFLADRTGSVIVPGYSIPCEDGSYLMKLLTPFAVKDGTPLSEVAQQCWDVFEPAIREFPEPWLWMYKHWRYLPDGEANYPAYANRSKKFDKWLRS
jgi:lauroyl/myristoyl acyltransferase